jgi:hypothetical protein
MSKLKKNALLLFASTTFTVILIECGLQLFWLKSEEITYFWPPNLKKELQPNSSIFSGIEGNSYFVTNSIGFRADELPKESCKQIIAIGGSTTECYYLDQSETWTDLLQQGLNKWSKTPVCQKYERICR